MVYLILIKMFKRIPRMYPNTYDITDIIVSKLFNVNKVLETSGHTYLFYCFIGFCILCIGIMIILFLFQRSGKIDVNWIHKRIAGDDDPAFLKRILVNITSFCLCLLFFNYLGNSETPYEIIIVDEIATIKSISKTTLIDRSDIKKVRIYPGIITRRNETPENVCNFIVETKEGSFRFYVKLKELNSFNLKGCKKQQNI